MEIDDIKIMYKNKVYTKLKTRIVNLIDKGNSIYPPKSSPVIKKNEIAPTIYNKFIYHRKII